MACEECAKGRFESDCDVHVHCDDACEALREPVTFEEYKAAYEHWSSHSSLAGAPDEELAHVVEEEVEVS